MSEALQSMPAPRLVVALDVPDPARAVPLVERLAPLGVLFKVGYEAFYGYGDAIRAALAARNAGYALDLKLHDIPRTVEAAVHAVVRPGVRLLTVHALGGAQMLEAAVDAAGEARRRARHPGARDLRGDDPDQHRRRGPGRAGPDRRTRRERDAAGRAGARRALRRRRLQRARGRRRSRASSARSSARSVRGFARRAPRTATRSAPRRRARRAKPAPTTPSSGARSSTTPIRSARRARSWRSCTGERDAATDLLRELEARGAILSGHFRLSSGRHSNRFVQKFRILEDPVLVERVAARARRRARDRSRRPSSSAPRSAASCSATRRRGSSGRSASSSRKRTARRRCAAASRSVPATARWSSKTSSRPAAPCARCSTSCARTAPSRPASAIIVQRASADFGVPTVRAARSADRVVRAGRVPAVRGRRAARPNRVRAFSGTLMDRAQQNEAIVDSRTDRGPTLRRAAWASARRIASSCGPKSRR